MSRKHAVVLIQPHCSFTLEGESVLNTAFDSIGLLSLAAFMRQYDIPVRQYHFARALSQGIFVDEMFERITEADPALFGISINWLHLSEGALEIARELKQRLPRTPIVVGGQHASLFASDIMQHHADVFDGVVVGEGEETLLEIARNVRDGRSFSDTAGVMTSNNGCLKYTPRTVDNELEALPLLSYEGIYPEIPSDNPLRRVGALDTCRGGCRKNCNYCLESSALGTLGRSGPIAYTAERLANQVASYAEDGRDFVTIQDQIFTHAPSLLVEFAGQLGKRRINLKHLSLFVEPGNFDKAVYQALSDAPIEDFSLSFGIETGSPKVAANLNRNSNYDAIVEELELVSAMRFNNSTWWMVGLPEEGADEIEQTKQMILDTMALGIHPKWVTPLILFPQAPLARQLKRFKIKQLLKTFDDFRVFSTTPRNEYGLYPELITHESDFQSVDDTLRYLKNIKDVIEKNYSIVDEKNRNKIEHVPFSRFQKHTLF